MFITAFWKARDDDPNTPENKFKDEHYRRIEYANKNFGRGLKAGGWRSDMGRIYITLGEPKTIERYENESNVYPMIVWFYSGITGAGPAEHVQRRLLQEGRGRRLHPLFPGPGRPPEAHAVLQRRHDELPPGLGGAEADRPARWPSISMSLIPGRVCHWA